LYRNGAGKVSLSDIFNIPAMKLHFYILLPFILIFSAHSLSSQSIFKIHGVIKYTNGDPVINRRVTLQPLNRITYTGSEGKFNFEFTGNYNITLVVRDSLLGDLTYEVKPNDINSALPINIVLQKSSLGFLDPINSKEIPVIMINPSGDEETSENQEISSLLTASRDLFVSTANFNLFALRFKTRGYDNEYNSVFVNGIPMSDPETGNLVFGEWGGLNDVMRNTDLVYGLKNADFTIGKPGSNIAIDLRASQQRATKRFSYALSNRSYRNRIMGTYNTGKLANGWSLSLSASYRWAEEGYTPGTFYKGVSYFAGVEKEINKNHSLGLTIFGSKLIRGKSSANTLESYELAGDNYYNPYWGYQNNEKRNTRVSEIHKPIGILRHDWKIGNKSTLTSSVSYQTGYESNTRLDWYQSKDPRPDYYRYLPSYIEDANYKSFYENLYRTDESKRQINWNYMYDVNRSNIETIQNANGIPGNDITGKRAQYMVEDDRQDLKIFNFNSTFETVLNTRWVLQGGISYQDYTSSNYKLLNDLLGADFSVDIDKFATFDNPLANENNDISTPNRIIKTGDRYGYDFNYHVKDASMWLQNTFTLKRFDFFLGGSFGRNMLYRDGLNQNGKFPDNSKGESEHLNFNEYAVKGGATYKVNGRNYIFANAAYFNNAPLVENLFISPRTRNDVIDNPQNEKIASVEGGYILNAPYYKLRLSGYYTDIKDGMQMVRFYNDADQSNDIAGFLNQSITNIDHIHTGIEFAGEYTLFTGFKVNAIASIGKYYYTSRFSSSYYLDNSATTVAKDRKVYSINYYFPGTPQQAGSVGLSYNGKQFWFININANYARKTFISPFWDRRTYESVINMDENDPKRIALLAEEELPSAFTLDLFAGKSWKINSYYLNLNLGISNLLNNQNIITNGYEQSRLGVDQNKVITLEKFPNKYYYAYGLNYFASLALRF